ncbi:hypothetical protein [Paramaledivibacter caminithermalis]|jgi:hypothetical protein|uniref:Uncharacterized protein n=1 Tax=Paramaledivibacter caminithermalis (strain DSM 15212 / CIP 107654 / DViRD3) TaxID=1121301 RepID=A0A1M6KIL7_PARC5|nr:hypothetical protein [Paramaledivibacter caminithermalis]SHJ58802.1 hypothetical protein SAMN02745912_00419 [Paramaledivibacter caminithermalis DSM 15212]
MSSRTVRYGQNGIGDIGNGQYVQLDQTKEKHPSSNSFSYTVSFDPVLSAHNYSYVAGCTTECTLKRGTSST